MKAIVHIGTEKTGTTSIQRFLYQNKKELKRAGYHFLQSAGKANNRALPAYCVSNDRTDDFFRTEGIHTPEDRQAFREQFIVKFEKELSSLGKKIHTVVISSEHFHSRLRTEEELDNVYALLGKYFDEFQIVCYLREQVGTCTSYYSTGMKSGSEVSFVEFFQRCNPENYYFNYMEFLSNWERCFGRDALDVSLFRKDLFLNGNLLDDFTAKLDPKLVGRLNRNVKVENESLTPAGQTLARGVNMAFPVRTSRPEILVLHDKCKTYINENFKGTGRQPSLDMQKEIHEEFAELNEALRLKYFPDMDVIFQTPTKEPAKEIGVDETFIDGLINLLKMMGVAGAGVLTDDEYAHAYVNMVSCVSDLAEPEEGSKKEGKKAIISMDDLRLMRSAAGFLEQRSPVLSKSLLVLALEVMPTLPNGREKLEKYDSLIEMWSLPQFMIRYSVETDAIYGEGGPDFLQRIDAWLMSIDDRSVGGTLNSLSSACTVASDGLATPVKESLSMGYTIIRAESAEEVHNIAAKMPFLEIGGSVEVTELTTVDGSQ